MSKSLSWPASAPAHDWRRPAALLLRLSSRLMARWARRLAPRDPVARPEPVLEFYAEAGAPEGALYVDGRRVGVLPGVMRL